MKTYGRCTPTGKSPWYPLDTRLGGAHSRSGSWGEEKNLCHLWELNPDSPVAHFVIFIYSTSYTRSIKRDAGISSSRSLGKKADRSRRVEKLLGARQFTVSAICVYNFLVYLFVC
jgi:hypothetical protein